MGQKWMRAASAVLVSGVLALTIPAIAPAAGVYLAKKEARRVAVSFIVTEMQNMPDWSDERDYSVDSPRACVRKRATVVECGYAIWDPAVVDDEGRMYGCEDTIRIRETRRRYLRSYPYEPVRGFLFEAG